MSNCKFVTLDQVSIRPSPKGEGNQHFIFRRNFIGQFQFALLPKMKEIYCDSAYKKPDHSMPKAGVIPAIGIED
jgi:hypothetical protein